ncbi:MAG: PPC domain-containing DNA-binding protein [Candidatus Acidiferrales bacterium]
MIRPFRNSATPLLILIAAFGTAARLSPGAQQPPPLPEGYVVPGPVTARGLAPRMHGEQLPTAGSRTFEVMFGPGDEIMSGLTEFAEKNHITSGYISGIGGLATATLGWGDPEKGGVKTIPVEQKCELASFLGNISMQRGKIYVHAHAVVSFSDGSTKGGHLVDAHANPFVEIYIVTTDSPAAATSSPSGK